MIERLSATQKRLAALALAAALAGLAYAALLGPIIDAHRRYDERIAELRHRLEQYKRIARDHETTQRALEQRKRADLARRYYLAERNPALAAAELQGLVKRAVEQAKGELISTQVVNGQRIERLAEVTVKVRVRGDIRTVQRMLHALEAGAPILFVSNLSISGASGARAARVASAAGSKDLLIGVDVSGFTREKRG